MAGHCKRNEGLVEGANLSRVNLEKLERSFSTQSSVAGFDSFLSIYKHVSLTYSITAKGRATPI